MIEFMRGARTALRITRIPAASNTASNPAVKSTILGACFHNSVRPDPVTGEAALRRYADELSDMAIAYLSTPDRFADPH